MTIFETDNLEMLFKAVCHKQNRLRFDTNKKE
jgi:hypothetical protein